MRQVGLAETKTPWLGGSRWNLCGVPMHSGLRRESGWRTRHRQWRRARRSEQISDEDLPRALSSADPNTDAGLEHAVAKLLQGIRAKKTWVVCMPKTDTRERLKQAFDEISGLRRFSLSSHRQWNSLIDRPQ